MNYFFKALSDVGLPYLFFLIIDSSYDTVWLVCIMMTTGANTVDAEIFKVKVMCVLLVSAMKSLYNEWKE